MYDEPNDTLVKEMHKYGRKNLALIHVMIQSPYVTKIKRDVSMTFTTYIANSGGLLGLCLGFSFMSGIEIIFCLCWLFGRFKRKFFTNQNKTSNTVKYEKDKSFRNTNKSKKDSIDIIEEGGTSLQNSDNSTEDVKSLVNDIGKSICKIKISPLNGSYLKISYSCFNPSAVMFLLKTISKVRKGNKTILDTVCHLVSNLCIK